jgi:hypothetical protein
LSVIHAQLQRARRATEQPHAARAILLLLLVFFVFWLPPTSFGSQHNELIACSCVAFAAMLSHIPRYRSMSAHQRIQVA